MKTGLEGVWISPVLAVLYLGLLLAYGGLAPGEWLERVSFALPLGLALCGLLFVVAPWLQRKLSGPAAPPRAQVVAVAVLAGVLLLLPAGFCFAQEGGYEPNQRYELTERKGTKRNRRTVTRWVSGTYMNQRAARFYGALGTALVGACLAVGVAVVGAAKR